MPEDVAFISSKSGVDMSRDGKVMSVARKIADRQMAFRLYIVDIVVMITRLSKTKWKVEYVV